MNAVYVPGYTIEDQRAGRPMTIARQSEITRLLWADVDDQKRTCIVRDAKHPRAKAGNHRTFPLLGAAWEIVQRQPRTAPEIFPYQSKSVGTAFTRACKDLRIDDLHFHDLRHEATQPGLALA